MIELKRILEEACLIHKWNPTIEQLERIKTEIEDLISRGKRISKNDLSSIVSRNCPGTILAAFEGADNSDLNALLAIAINKSK